MPRFFTMPFEQAIEKVKINTDKAIRAQSV
jgi:hypothetical protein